MKEFILLLPEFFLAVTLAGLVFAEVGYHGERTRLISATALLGLGGAFIQTILTYQYGATQIFGKVLSIDGFSLFFKLFFIFLASLAILTSMSAKEIRADKRAEYCALIVASALAMCLAASASDLLLAFLALQFLNVLGYFLSAFGKSSVLSTEAAVKHLVFGVVSGVLLLYGVAILFSATHAINIYDMHKVLVSTPLSRETGLVVFTLILLSLCFQFAAFPMHLWAPDVLEGAPTPVSAFLAIGSRAVGFAVAVRLLLVVFAQPAMAQGQWQVLGGLDWPKVAALVSGVTMTIGALLAFRQTGAKRMVAYLVISQTGFLLLGLLVLDEVGVAALLYNLVVELFAIMGVFFVLSFLFDELRSDRLDALKGMMARAVPECIALVLFLACLIGLPPLPGFIVATVAVGRLSFSLIGDFRKASASPVPHDTSRRIFLVMLFVPMLLVGLFADVVLGWAGQSLRFILW
jgi:NADH-quinone oxidoreductase subunit N